MVDVAVAAAPAELSVATVAGFPSGKHLPEIKAREAALAVAAGAAEVDVVLDVGAALSGDFAAVTAEVAAVRKAVPTAVLKVIVESAALLSLADADTLTATCRAAADGGADFVKTSTGFHPAGGASVTAISIMAAAVGADLGVKASGGIRTAADAIALLEAGATRLGLSGTAAVLDGLS
jgi:deoxyribose-phosphate aldolase